MTTRRALLDTSVLVSMSRRDERPIDLSMFDELFVSSLCYSEMRMGLATVVGAARQRRQDRLDDVTRVFGAGLPYDDRAALEYGRIVRESVAAGRGARTHTLDRMIAAVAVANDLALATRNSADVQELSHVVDIVAV
ncbi:type II toxin-antitoxin system VapC family toxin [Williamsia sp. M5A3_1d]